MPAPKSCRCCGNSRCPMRNDPLSDVRRRRRCGADRSCRLSHFLNGGRPGIRSSAGPRRCADRADSHCWRSCAGASSISSASPGARRACSAPAGWGYAGSRAGCCSRRSDGARPVSVRRCRSGCRLASCRSRHGSLVCGGSHPRASTDRRRWSGASPCRSFRHGGPAHGVFRVCSTPRSRCLCRHQPHRRCAASARLPADGASHGRHPGRPCSRVYGCSCRRDDCRCQKAGVPSCDNDPDRPSHDHTIPSSHYAGSTRGCPRHSGHSRTRDHKNPSRHNS